MKRVIFLACLTLSGYASPQDGYQWVNSTLRERRVPLEQYVAMGKGHFAQRQISSNRDAHAAVKGAPEWVQLG